MMPAGPHSTVAPRSATKAAEGSLSRNWDMHSSAPAASRNGTKQWKRRSPAWAHDWLCPGHFMARASLHALHVIARMRGTLACRSKPGCLCAPVICELLASSSIQPAARPKGSAVSSATSAASAPAASGGRTPSASCLAAALVKSPTCNDQQHWPSGEAPMNSTFAAGWCVTLSMHAPVSR